MTAEHAESWWPKTDQCVVEERLKEPEQRLIFGRPCPLVLVWQRQAGSSCESERARLQQWLHAQQTAVETALSEHGAVVFRGFPVESADDFDGFVGGFTGWRDLSYSDSLSFAVRTHVVGRVCTTNDGKNGGMVFHHEQAQTPKWPSKLLFYCQTPAERGGGTGVASSALVMAELERVHPDFVAKCEALGVQYTCYLAADADPSKGVGRGWKSFWGRDTKAAAEERMRQFGYSWQWTVQPDSGEEILRCTTPVLPCVRTAPLSNRRVFFNQLVAQLTNAQEWAARAGQTDHGLDMTRFLTFGDGSPVDVAPLEFARAVADGCAVEINWQKNDIALLDNYLVMHARRPFEGHRQVLASLVE